MLDCLAERKKVTCPDHRWHKDCVVFWISVKSGQRCSGITILVTLPAPCSTYLLLTHASSVYIHESDASYYNITKHFMEFHYIRTYYFSQFSTMPSCEDQLCCKIRKYSFVPTIHLWVLPVYIAITWKLKQLVISNVRIQEHPVCIWLQNGGVLKPLMAD